MELAIAKYREIRENINERLTLYATLQVIKFCNDEVILLTRTRFNLFIINHFTARDQKP